MSLFELFFAVPFPRWAGRDGGRPERSGVRPGALGMVMKLGWSFYKHAAEPRKDTGVQCNLAKSDAPHWAATEWLLQGNHDTAAWRAALANTLGDKRCRYVCIFNWESIRSNTAALDAVTSLVTSDEPR